MNLSAKILHKIISETIEEVVFENNNLNTTPDYAHYKAIEAMVRELLNEKKLARTAALAAGLAGSGCAALGTCDRDQTNAFKPADKPGMQRTVVNTNFRNSRGILQNSLNGITIAAYTGGSVNKAVDSFFKELKIAHQRGDLSRKEVKAVLSALRDNDIATGIKKASEIIGTGT